MNLQVYLAVPNDCPYFPDGKKRKLSAEDSVSTSVNMYVSNDEGTSFAPVGLPPVLLHFLPQLIALRDDRHRCLPCL